MLSTAIENEPAIISNDDKIILEKNTLNLKNCNSDSLFIDWKSIGNATYLYFKFNGIFSYQSCVEGVNKWTDMVQNQISNIHLVWNCTEMQAYEPKARLYWQKALEENYFKIASIHLITSSPIVKIGTQIMMMNSPL
ncbi:MAG: hypothetical protein CMO01_19795, partial [Thalassobius sp.]|nr:hypothetical protein [Thalassovita sp.]